MFVFKYPLMHFSVVVFIIRTVAQLKAAKPTMSNHREMLMSNIYISSMNYYLAGALDSVFNKYSKSDWLFTG